MTGDQLTELEELPSMLRDASGEKELEAARWGRVDGGTSYETSAMTRARLDTASAMRRLSDALHTYALLVSKEIGIEHERRRAEQQANIHGSRRR